MTTESELIMQAARLARSAPSEWDRFLGALQKYSDEMVEHCVRSPLDELPRAQGRAQITVRLQTLLKDCIPNANKLERLQK